MISDMATHEIRLPDSARVREFRTISWDDEAGTISGDHFNVAYLRDVLAALKPVIVGGVDTTWDLAEPGRRPEEFLVFLYMVWWPVLNPEHRNRQFGRLDPCR